MGREAYNEGQEEDEEAEEGDTSFISSALLAVLLPCHVAWYCETPPPHRPLSSPRLTPTALCASR